MIKLVNSDLCRFNFHENTIVWQDKIVDNYLHGRCHIFAYALSKCFAKGEVRLLMTNDENNGKELLCHAFLYLPNNCVLDASGITSDAEIEDFGTNEPEETFVCTMSDLEFLSNFTNNKWGCLEDGEIEGVQQFIKNNLAVFTKGYGLNADSNENIDSEAQIIKHLVELGYNVL